MSYVIRRNGLHARQSAEVREKYLKHFKYGYFLQKCIDSLQEAFIHPPELCEARFIMNARAFSWLLLDCWQKTSAYSRSTGWKSKDKF